MKQSQESFNAGFYLDAEEPVRAVGFLLAALDRQLSHYLECGDIDEDVHGALDAMVAAIRGEHQKVTRVYG